MASQFVLEKGDLFRIDKGIRSLHVGTKWEPAKSGPQIDVDAHAVLLVHLRGDSSKPVMYGEGSHFLTYANKSLPPAVDEDGDVEGFQTDDGSMWHSKDNRRGGDGGGDHAHHGDGHAHDEALSEEIMIHLDKLPERGVEIAVWLTLDKARERNQDFSKIEGLFVEVCNAEGEELCRYHPKGEFAGFTALQVGSLMKNPDGTWHFVAIGAGSKAGLGEIINAYQG